jgi:hypothetical protein
MQFNDYLTHYQLAKAGEMGNDFARGLRNITPREFFVGYVHRLDEISRAKFGKPIEQVDPFTPAMLTMETEWHEAGRPYYNLWPSIIPALTKLHMDADSSFFRLPLDQLLIRLPVNDNSLSWEWQGKPYSVRAVLCGNVQLITEVNGKAMSGWAGKQDPALMKRGIAMWIDAHEPLPDAYAGLASNRLHRMMYKHVVCEEGKSIEWSFDNIPAHDSADVGVNYPDQVVRDVARIVCTLCLMAEDKDLVEPIVLRSDEDKFDRTGDLGLVTKAIRRGNYGFNVGRNIECVPHVRSASPAALYWTGPGRKVPRIRFRRGTVVHRKRLASVPTGFLDMEKGESQ